ncbi:MULTISPECIES: NADH-dependent flavin oxidoreductase [Neisseria]|jgi:NADH-dependent flavin oxidoreductase, oye family|uniref:Oxidoreductase, FAD/FMN-binding protein n=1 Tax=Neisseria subflava NJ9703 TaxID=546268 RepID=A0A9W5ISD6_NEISU|nr:MULTISPECIES: NADH-dependent flavin oxidoreductase [Neisseria]EFC52758.1 oxidoreductase, FAD/FMN-binding protein [Neisseria subflava NJ9703]OFN21345.1 NADH-dependent flavin oxidoreductase [Neisseria sp. HMSC072B12]
MNPKYAPLFQTYTLNNGVTIKNRLAVAPMTHYGSQADGLISDQERTFLSNRAGDMGLFITATTLVQKDGKAFHGQPEATGEHCLDSLKETAQILRQQGTKAILQIHHGGSKAIDELLDGLDKISASTNEAEHAREATAEEVEALIASYAQAADLALRAGFDGVEIHGANGYLIQQFYSAQSNRRNDQWGGSLENRMRFPLAVVDAVVAVREKHQRDDFIIGYRFSPEEPGDDGLTMTETGALIDALVQKPLQYLHVSLWEFDKKIRRGGDTTQTRMQFIHERINGKLPLIGVGNLFTADQILAAYETGWAEFIALGKTVMINPHIATQIREGREDEIETQLDPTRADHYGLPDTLWGFASSGTQSWLPPVKGAEWKPMDI